MYGSLFSMDWISSEVGPSPLSILARVGAVSVVAPDDPESSLPDESSGSGKSLAGGLWMVSFTLVDEE